MASYLAHINVMLRPLVNDPQGLVVKDGLHALGFEHVAGVRVGKRIEITLDAATQTSAEEQVSQMCDRLLANAVIEDYEFTVSAVVGA
ncbi:MAG: phosphoribosylformylglycinamidine synthase subunit PurS [Dehalococcoidia bacterium]